ncbi:hypothetical protein [Solidesulfovibrio alcoholivorans]|uniref:hypothetical protein n=1 Tax=Solidesulfovibrio alcoholivorans TaxID=81406 RepID=UPI00049626BB|nr:hypothetical protein [Solidesulfovibrio alcoholivorans]
MQEPFDVFVAQESARLGVHRSTMVEAIQAGRCGGEHRDGYWYTSTTAAAKWYAEYYRHAGALYSQSAGKNWAKDLPRMREMLEAGKSVEEVAAALKRSVNAIKIKACKEKIRPKQIAKMVSAQRQTPPPSVAPSPGRVAQVCPAIAEDDRPQPRNRYTQRRQDDREGRLRIHVAPEVKRRLAAGLARINARLPDGERVSMAQFLSWAGLAALEDEAALRRGRALAEKL